MKLLAVGGFCCLDGIRGAQVLEFSHQARLLKRLPDILPFGVGIRVDLMREIAVSLIAVEADIVRAGAHPHRLSICGERAFHIRKWWRDATTRTGIALRVSIILRAAEQLSSLIGMVT